MLCPLKEAAILDASRECLPVDLDFLYSGSNFLARRLCFYLLLFGLLIKGQRPCLHRCYYLNGLNAPAYVPQGYLNSPKGLKTLLYTVSVTG